MKKIISIIITISMLLASVPAFAISGTGTESNPYLISYASDIAKIHDDLDGYYKLANNINMSGIAFEPIGNETEGAFTGTIDGDGYTISNLNINLPENKYVGFVGYLEGTIKNLNITNVDAYGYRYVGGLVGYAETDSEIYNCSVNGTVGATHRIIDSNIGGIIGCNYGKTNNCTNNSKVSSSKSKYTGGVAGYSYGTISNCINNGAISGNGTSIYVGGIAGYGMVTDSVNNETIYGIGSSDVYVGGINGNGTASNCKNNATIQAIATFEPSNYVEYPAYAGGINGIGTAINCVNNGDIKCSACSVRVGGICGKGTATRCVNEGNISGTKTSGGDTGYAGGIVGIAETVKDCSNIGNLNIVKTRHAYYVGGIAGENNGTVSNCINYGTFTFNLSDSTFGGVVGYNKGSVANCVDDKGNSLIDYNYGNATINNIICSNATINLGAKGKLHIELFEYDGRIIYTSHDESIAIVDADGMVTGKKVGTTSITASTELGVTSTAIITITEPSTNIALNKSAVNFYINSTYQLSASVYPNNTTDSITWSSSNTNCVTVSNNGLITGINEGTATITARTTSGLTATCYVTVKATPVEPTSITLSDTYITLAPEDAKALTATLLPSNTTETTLIWTSSNDDVAIVDRNGVITAIGEGFATIKAKTANGLSHECVVKVVSVSGPSIIVDNVKSFPAGIAKTKVNIIRNPGISGYKFTINYDDVLLTPVAVTANEEFGGTLTTNLDDANRTEFNVVWYSNGDTDIDINGELFTIDFKVAEAAELGDYSDISIEYGAKDICNTAGENIALYAEPAKVTIEEPLPGDIYEDGDVNIYDLTLLARHMIGLADFTDRQMEAANVTDDELVDIKDVVKLAQYVVGWTGVELMSLMSLDAEVPETPTVTVGTASVNDANEADIPVYIKNNTGIAAYRFVLDYNADDIEIVSITPSDFINPENFGTNIGQENDEGLIVFCYQEGNAAADGELFTVKVRYKHPTDTSISPISIKSAENNFCNQEIENVTANYETGYALGDDYIVANKVVSDTNFSCELYFDDSYAEQSAKAIIAFYDGDGRMVQLMPKDITVKPGKVDLSIDYDKKTYATYKLMIWEGMNSLKPITEVK